MVAQRCASCNTALASFVAAAAPAVAFAAAVVGNILLFSKFAH